MRVYYDNSVPMEIIEQLKELQVQLVDMTNSKMNKMSWRFQAASDAKRFCARDIDSRLSKREAAAVEEWVQSGKQFHVMRDHPSHSNYPMSGGMWCSTTIPNMEAMLTDVKNQAYLQDMNFLNKVIWPMAQKSLVQHDSFSCDKFGGGKPFPTPRVGWEHVGSVYINGKMRQGDVDILKNARIAEKCSKDNFNDDSDDAVKPTPNTVWAWVKKEKKLPRILVGIFSIAAELQRRKNWRNLLKDKIYTGGELKHGMNFVFVLGKGNKIQDSHGVIILDIVENMNDGKTPKWFEFAVQTYTDADYIVKMDSDTQLNIQELDKAFVSPIDYVGRPACYLTIPPQVEMESNKCPFYYSGAWYGISRRLVLKMVETLKNVKNEDATCCKRHEDKYTGWLLEHSGITQGCCASHGLSPTATCPYKCFNLRINDNWENSLPAAPSAIKMNQGDSGSLKYIVHTDLTCFPRASGKMPVRKGQVTDTTTFGKALTKLASRQDVKRIIEIGTWYGGGSTQSFVDGLKSKSKCTINITHHCCEAFVTTFEVYKPAWEYARLYHQNNPVWLVLGTSVGEEDMLQPADVPQNEQGEHYKLYYERDRKIMQSQTPQLASFCDRLRPDVVLIDGNEYTGWGEFNVAIQRCKPKWLALHDTGTLKTQKVEVYINEHPDVFILESKGTDGASWSIYRVKYNLSPDTLSTSTQHINSKNDMDSRTREDVFSFCPTLECTESPMPHVSSKLKDVGCVTSNMGIHDLLLPVNTNNGVVIDIGANDGSDYSLYALRKGYLVYAFEPIKATAASFVQTMKNNGFGDKISVVHVTPGQPAIVPKTPLKDYVVLFVAAAGAHTSKVTISVSPIGETTSLIAGNGMSENSRTTEVAVVKLDDIILSTQQIKLLKIDSQGFEPSVLQGASRLLSDKNVEKLTFEFWPKGMKRGGADPVQMLEMLWRKGWQCFDWSTNEHIPDDRPSEFVGFVDSFYTRSGGKKCLTEKCWTFGLWDELFCAPRSLFIANKKPIQQHPFKIIVLTQRRFWSLERLLKSLNNADYGGNLVHLEIRVDYHDSDEHSKTLVKAREFVFKHGTSALHEYTETQGLQYAWFNAWTPISDDERAVIIEDDMELSPLWFSWLQNHGRLTATAMIWEVFRYVVKDCVLAMVLVS